jgi:hypothetical protein
MYQRKGIIKPIYTNTTKVVFEGGLQVRSDGRGEKNTGAEAGVDMETPVICPGSCSV